MRPETRVAFNHFLDRQAELNNIPAEDVRGGKKFTIEPSVQQKLIDRQQEDSSFLGAINITPVEELKGEKLGLTISGPIAGRSNTGGGTARTTTDPTGLDQEGYECKQTNSDTHVTYAKLDQWAKFPDFQVRMRNLILKRQGLDRIMIGFNGTSAAATTNKGTSPLLQDVNIGWLKHLKNYNSASHVLSEGEQEDGKIIIGSNLADCDYKNVDALVVDAVHNLLPTCAHEDEDLVCILGSNLAHDIYFPLINSDLVPTEKNAAQLIISAKRVGGKKAVRVPYFPANSILVTRLDNLSIYEQSGKRRRTIVDKAELDRIQTFESSNDGYVIEDYDFACLIENVQFGPT